ncbi:Fur family transcriptional regulator [Paraburkholderia acidisoli]|uniref:Ferric uptake regulation protein n=1 Tax=Paraburkholderia acidisoli TaxID=2571748 RepID=A0A7Z2JJY1_9BURK|nr:Fur family transcriptional regulator [Paraburkholderia acidisoli]QGZ66743.1 ferric iron uptake transcriptional regulator [Paraburkholderia acidisoli]
MSDLHPHTGRFMGRWPAPELKRTRSREVVLALLYAALREDTHLGAEAFYRRALQAGWSISLSSVYRALADFEQLGLIQVHAFAGLRKVYELDAGQSHDHLVNVDTGEISHLPAPAMDACCAAVAEENGLKVVRRAVTLYVRAIEPIMKSGE